MSALVARSRRAARGGLFKLAERAGGITKSLPSAVGALAVSWGLGEIYHPLLWIGLGMFALAADWKRTAGSTE